MATPQKEGSIYDAFSSYGRLGDFAENANNTFHEITGWQMRAAHSFYDQGMKAAQAWADFAQAQIQEGTRLSKEILKMGLQSSDDLTKSIDDLSTKYIRSSAKQ